MLKYVVRLISISSNVGKTSLGTKLVNYLVRRGYDVGVIKHCVHGMELEVKDTLRYLEAGAKLVAASSKDLLIIYNPLAVDDVKYVLQYVDKPIVIVEGFKSQPVGDAIAIVHSTDEFNNLVNTTEVSAVLSDDVEVINVASSKGIPAFRTNDVEKLFKWVESRALESIINSLPRRDCGICGYTSCTTFAYAYLKREVDECPVTSQVKLLVNNIAIQLNPFTKRMISSIINGLLNSLKDVPQTRRKIIIELTSPTS